MNSLNPFMGIYAVGFFARLSYALARSPVLPLFALYFGAGPEAIGWVVGISTVTGISLNCHQALFPNGTAFMPV
jgi:MFS transporter, DHA1 family, multidrug resistance protein